jgi:hypothetical protein
MPLHVLQNGKAECTIHTINNVIRTLLIQASLPGRYWAEGLHTVMYLLNRLPMKMISVVCPHVTLFGSTPLYEHLRVFGCASYPNIAATAPHKLTPRSTRCVFLGYSADHKGYRCLDLSANHLIVSRHVIFDDDSFPFTASSSLTYLNFLCESGPMVSTIGTHLTTAGTSTLTPHRPTLEIPLGFEPPVAPLPALAVPLVFLPRVATTATPPAIIDGPPPHTWSASPVAYVQWEVRAGAAGTRDVLGAALRREVGCWSPDDM